MNRGAKQNWFESPHAKNSIWHFHDDKIDLFNSSKISAQERLTFLTPSHHSKPTEIERNSRHSTYSNHENQNCKFDDINLPDMFSNTLIERQVINEKLNFEESSVISEENDFHTPSRNGENGKVLIDKVVKDLPKTAIKQGQVYHPQQKKPRPKQKGLRMLSQKAYEIVTKMNGATYKQVANKLVDQLAVEDTVQINVLFILSQGKDQQNIKRRVYDALNVLIALGILKKEGRKIYGLRTRGSVEEAKHDEFKRAFSQNQLRRLRILQKNKQLKNTKLKAQMIKALIKRNTLFPAKDNRIGFPFIALNLEQDDENNVNIKDDGIQILTTLKNVETFGDIDAIQFIRPSLRTFIQ